jgi:hypothetical protein
MLVGDVETGHIDPATAFAGRLFAISTMGMPSNKPFRRIRTSTSNADIVSPAAARDLIASRPLSVRAHRSDRRRPGETTWIMQTMIIAQTTPVAASS